MHQLSFTMLVGGRDKKGMRERETRDKRRDKRREPLINLLFSVDFACLREKKGEELFLGLLLILIWLVGRKRPSLFWRGERERERGKNRGPHGYVGRRIGGGVPM